MVRSKYDDACVLDTAPAIAGDLDLGRTNPAGNERAVRMLSQVGLVRPACLTGRAMARGERVPEQARKCSRCLLESEPTS